MKFLRKRKQHDETGPDFEPCASDLESYTQYHCPNTPLEKKLLDRPGSKVFREYETASYTQSEGNDAGPMNQGQKHKDHWTRTVC